MAIFVMMCVDIMFFTGVELAMAIGKEAPKNKVRPLIRFEPSVVAVVGKGQPVQHLRANLS